MWPFNSQADNWRQEFVTCARRALGQDDISFDDALAALDVASGEQLLRFDVECRAGWYQGKFRGRIQSDRGQAVIEEARLFFRSCDRNGHERERALLALRRFNGRLTCAAALIRANDWVPNVNRIALEMVSDIARSAHAGKFFGLLDLVLAQRGRRRFEANWQVVETALRDPRWRSERAAARLTADPRTRRFALELALHADSDTTPAALESAVLDSSPLVAAWALTAADRELTGDVRRRVVHRALHARLARIRADALRRYVAGGYPDALDVLRSALLDGAHAPRNVAAFELARTAGEQALPHWRAAFDRGEHVAAITAALAEHGEVADQPRLRSQLAHRRSRVRAIALRGLCRTGARDASDLLTAALLDSSPHYAAAALEIYAHGAEKPTRATLENALTGAASPGLRRRLIAAGRLLGKWEALGFILNLHLDASVRETDALDDALHGWQQSFNRSFTQPGPQQRAEISRALAALRAAQPSKRWDTISYLAS